MTGQSGSHPWRRPQAAAWALIVVAAGLSWPLAAWRGTPMKPGQIVNAAITLVTSDREDLACGADRSFGQLGCDFSVSGQPATSPPAARDRLAPYLTLTRQLFLLPALFAHPALAARYQREPPTGVARTDLRRFVAHCQLRLREKAPALAVRWEHDGPWHPTGDAWVAEVVDCRVED